MNAISNPTVHALRGGRAATRGFSLTEVVLALGIFAFAVVALLGLLTVALSSSQESGERLAASNLAAEIIGKRRSSPDAELAGFVLPRLTDVSATSAESAESNQPGAEVGPGGFEAPNNEGKFLCVYRLWKDPDTEAAVQAGGGEESAFRLVHVHLRLSWPVGAARTNAVATKHFEVKTAIALQ